MSSQQAFLRRARFTCLLQFTDIFCTLPVYVTHRDPQTVLHLEMPRTALTEGSIVPPDPGHRLQQMENTSVHNSSKPQHSLAAALHPCCVIPALQCSAGLAVGHQQCPCVTAAVPGTGTVTMSRVKGKIPHQPSRAMYFHCLLFSYWHSSC